MTMRLHAKFWFASAILMLWMGCSPQKPHYKIGVSQCSADIWREKQNAELRMGAYLQENVELRFAAAYDSDERQIEQIDSLIASGVDLLIVAPNQVATISPAIDRAFDQGIPVIVFERKTNSQKFTAFISADNYEMGRIMGEYIVSRLKGRGRVLEIKGLAGSSPAIERHNGFMEALKNAPDIEVVASLQGDWTEPRAHTIVSQWLAAHPDTPVDLVFGMNDRSAIGARTAFIEAGRKLPLFCGVDGLPGENGGICQVRDSILDASYIYPTHGDQVLQLGIDILEGKPYEKEILLQSALVTRENASSLLMQSEEMMRQTDYLDRLHEKADTYLHQLEQVGKRGMYATVGGESHQMEFFTGSLGIAVGRNDFRVLHDAVVLAGPVYFHEVLIHHSSGTDIEVSHFRVAHLSVGQSHILSRGLQL